MEITRGERWLLIVVMAGILVVGAVLYVALRPVEWVAARRAQRAGSQVDRVADSVRYPVDGELPRRPRSTRRSDG